MKTGRNAADKAPSPNSRLDRLGMRKASAKASMTFPIPNIAAVDMSRSNPRIRLTSVMADTVRSGNSNRASPELPGTSAVEWDMSAVVNCVWEKREQECVIQAFSVAGMTKLGMLSV